MALSSENAASVVIRLAEPRDLPDFMALAELTGPGFTSLPADEEKLTRLLDGSASAASGDAGAIVLALEDNDNGSIAGCAAVKRGGRKKKGFANFRTICDEDGVVRSLIMSDDYNKLTEIGGLFVHPDYRSKGVGKPLAQSRYLYLATAPQSFGARVFAELRGVIDHNGVSPFFDSACKPWLNMDFTEADNLCASGQNERLVALMPRKAISTEAFSLPARAAIGDCHETGRAARAMLENEGFRLDGVVDLLDGGALVVADTVALTSLKRSRLVRVKVVSAPHESEPLLLSTTGSERFRCVPSHGTIIDNSVLCNESVCTSLQVKDGDVLRVSPLTSRKTQNPEQRLALSAAMP